MTVSWIKNPMAVSYELYRSLDGGDTFDKLPIIQENSLYEAKTVTGIKSYLYKVRAAD